jgi:hypothetical protein
VERPAAVEEMVAEALRRLFLKPGADHHRASSRSSQRRQAGADAEEAKSSYVFRLFRLEEGGGLKELGIKLDFWEMSGGIVYALEFEDVERWRGFFKQELEAAVKAAEVVRERLPVEDRFPYMLGWVNSDVAISEGRLEMSTSHLWQLAETQALFDWSDVTVRGVNLTLEGPKPRFQARTSLEKLDEAVRKSAEGGWLKMLGINAESWEGLKRWVAKNWDIVVEAAVKRLGEEVRGELNALRDMLNDDKIAREAIAPALLLIQAEKLGVDETTLRYFGAVISGTIDGDGHVSAAMKSIELASGKREIALLEAAALAAYGTKAEVRRVRGVFHIIASSSDAAKLAGLYFRYGPPLLEGDERIINHKLAEAVELGAGELDIRWERLRRTKNGAAADLIISVGGAAVKYNVYLSENAIKLQFASSDRGSVELAARLLRHAGVVAEVQKEGNRDVWRVEATTDKLAAGREELRKALAEIVKTALGKGKVDASKAEGWLKKLEEGRVLMEGWPKYHVGLSSSGALVIRFASPNSDSIEREAQRLENMGLKRGVHFSVKTPGGGEKGYVSILREGLIRLTWLSVHGKDEQQKLAAAFVELILRRAEEADGGKCGKVCEKVKEIVEKGKAWKFQTLERFKERVEVNGKTYVVKVTGGEAVEEDRGGRKLLRIRITAEVGGVRRNYEITYSRHARSNAAVGLAYASADAPGGREADAERFAAVIKALTDKEPGVYRMKDGRIKIQCYEGHLEGFMRYAELADVIKKWLEETSRR